MEKQKFLGQKFHKRKFIEGDSNSKKNVNITSMPKNNKSQEILIIEQEGKEIIVPKNTLEDILQEMAEEVEEQW